MMGFGFGGVSMFFMMLFWVVVVILAVWLVSRLFPAAPTRPDSQPGQATGAASTKPVDLLKQRYARGEISKAEYEEMLTVLRA